MKISLQKSWEAITSSFFRRILMLPVLLILVLVGCKGGHKIFSSNMENKNNSVKSSNTLIPSTKPNATQQKLIDRGYGMFMHFGINTFLDV